MPFDPNSTVNPLPPLNDGYPDDWHVPPSAQDDNFPDDWHVPPAAQDDSFPDDWHVPPSAQGDGFPDDWFVPESALPSASQTVPITQPDPGNPGFAGWLAPPNSIADHWARVAVDRLRNAPWAPPVFLDASGQFPASSFAPALPFNLPPDMLFGGEPPTPANTDTPFPNLPRDVLFSGRAGLAPANVLASFRAAAQSFTAPDPFFYPGGNSFDAALRSNLSYASSQSADRGQLRPNEASDVVSDASAEDGDPNAILVSGTPEEQQEERREQQRRDRDRAIFNERAFGITPPRGSAAPRLVPPIPPNIGPGGLGSGKITAPYARPPNATTPQQRSSVQGQPCVDCGVSDPRMRANHIEPLVQQYYRTGSIDTTQMRSLDAVNAQCPTCSARQGGFMANFSKVMKDLFGF